MHLNNQITKMIFFVACLGAAYTSVAQPLSKMKLAEKFINAAANLDTLMMEQLMPNTLTYGSDHHTQSQQYLYLEIYRVVKEYGIPAADKYEERTEFWGRKQYTVINVYLHGSISDTSHNKVVIQLNFYPDDFHFNNIISHCRVIATPSTPLNLELKAPRMPISMPNFPIPDSLPGMQER
jgi:hypothetical protein